jgi:hypothetical protein
MCDYSLERVASRPARVGDKLVTTTFPNSFARGFAAVDRPDVAVCLLPGTELAFEGGVARTPRFGFFFEKHIRPSVARFRHINPDQPFTHHDALEFPDGDVVLLTRLDEGQHATVLQLPVQSGQGEEGGRASHEAKQKEAKQQPEQTLPVG